jgi:mannose-6-phosphate isomerase-like protein (cupin superfamily)
MMGDAFALGPGDGESVWSLGGRFTTKLGGDRVEDRFSMQEALVFQTAEPPMHIHHNEDEAWYVLEGHMTFHVGGAVLEAGPGTFAFGPRGVPHAFTVDDEPTRILVLASPAGFERFAFELGQPAMDDTPPADLMVPGPDVLEPVARRYGIEVVGPPIRLH